MILIILFINTGFFDFLLGKKKEVEQTTVVVKIVSPLNGTVIPLSEVPDPTFAEEMLGKGVGVVPEESGVVSAPVSGTIIQLFETKHAFVVETEDGIQVLTHFGLNTVKLNGEGFEAVAKEGDKVNAGDPIVKYDLDFLKANSDSVVTPVVVLEPDDFKNVESLVPGKSVARSTEIIVVEFTFINI